MVIQAIIKFIGRFRRVITELWEELPLVRRNDVRQWRGKNSTQAVFFKLVINDGNL